MRARHKHLKNSMLTTQVLISGYSPTTIGSPDASDPQKAIDYLMRADEASLAFGANEEAIQQDNLSLIHDIILTETPKIRW
jgi:hypothetical protein